MKRSTTLRIGGAALALLAVAACSGSNSGPAASPDHASYAAMANTIEQVRQEADGAAPTEIASMPSAGSGTYVGGMAVSHPDGSRMNAQMVLRADFNDGLVDGHLTNFSDARRGSLEGSLDMSGARIAGNQLTGTFEGNLQGEDGLAPASAEIWGNFHGADSEFLNGQIVLTQGSRAFDGDFVTMRPEPLQVD